MIQINPLQSYIDGGARAAITTPPSASLVFDLPGKAIWVKGVKLKGTDHTYTFSHDNYITLTNTPDLNNPESEDIKIGVNITTLKAAIDTTYSTGTLAQLTAGTNTTALVWTAKILAQYVTGVLPVTKKMKVNGADYAIFTTESSLPSFFAPVTLGTAGQILSCTANGLVWVNQTVNTDYQVTQSSIATNADYRVILKRSANDTAETTYVNFATTLTYNPSTKILKINGNRVVTFADIYIGATSSADATTGLVPVASSANRNKFLRGDGTWQVPTNDNTWRPIQVGSSEKLGSATNTGALNFVAGTGIEVSWDTTNKRIVITNTAPDVNHNTHYTTSLYIGANNDTKANAATANPYLKLFDDATRRSTLRFVAGDGITVSSDANGNITITNSKPDQNHNTDRTGVKLGTVSGTQKTDSTLIIANSGTGLVFQGGTNLFKIGDGTNYIEVPITPTITVTDKSANILTSLTTLATIDGTDIKAKITVEDKAATIGTSATTIATIGGTSITAKIGAYLPLAGGTMTGTPYINMPASAATISDSQPFGITYGRIQGYSNINIAADTDGSTSEYVIITAGYSVANATKANGLAIGYNTLTWKNNIIAHAGNISNKAATIGTSLTTIATIAGIDIKAKIASYSLSNHTHPLSIAADSGTSSIALAASTKYKLTAGGSTYVFTSTPDLNVQQVDNNNNENVPILLKNGTGTGTIISSVRTVDGVTINPSTNSLTVNGHIRSWSQASSWIDGLRYDRGGYNLFDATDTGSYWPWMRQTNTGSSKWFSMGVLNNSLYIIGSTTSRTENSYDYGWRFDVSNGWAYGNFLNSDTLDGIHANGLLTTASLGTNGNNTTLSVTVGGTTKTGSVTVPYATSAGNADTVDSQHANKFAWIYNSANILSSSSVTVNDMVSSGGSNATMAMIYAATDNPTGTSQWVHVWSQQWTINSAANWVSLIALGVAAGNGMWYRCSSGASAGLAWKRVLDSSNYTDYVKNASLTLLVRGSTLTTFYANDSTNRTFNVTNALLGNSISWDTVTINDTGRRFVRGFYNSTSNLNEFALYGHAIGMESLGSNGSNDNPGGYTGWHHVFLATWIDTREVNGTTSNEWCTQIANRCGTTDLWVRSRSGGSISNGTAWTANWTRILTGSNWTNVISLNNAALTLQTAGTTQTTFYANDSTNRTFNVTCANIGAATSSHNHDGRYAKTHWSFASGSDNANVTCTSLDTWVSRLNAVGGISNYGSISSGAWWWVRSTDLQVNNWNIRTSGAMMIYCGDGSFSSGNYKHFLVLDAYADLYGITSNEASWKYYARFLSSRNYTEYVNPRAVSKTIWGLTYIDSSGNFQSFAGNFNMSTGDQLNMTGASWDGFAFNYASGKSGGLATRFYNGAQTEIVRFLANGNVGIGTASPSYKLHIVGSIYSTLAGQFGNVRVGGYNMNMTEPNANIEFLTGTGYLDWHYNGSTGDYTTRLIENASGYLTLYGKLGVGGLSTGHNLYVAGTAYIRGSAIYWGNGDARMTIYGVDTCCGAENVAFQTTFDDQDPLTSSYPTSYPSRAALLLQPRGGRVGINVAHDPSYPLHVGGDVGATHYYETSDIRLKHDISMLSKSIRRFRFNNDNKLYYGFIAQELETLHPELVDSSGEYKTVNYNSAICYYIAELENKVLKLEDEINKLKSK